MGYIVLALLIILNLGVFAYNTMAPRPVRPDIPLADPGVPVLEVVPDVVPASYSSAAGITQSSCYTVGPYASELAAQQVMARIRNYGLGVEMRSLQTPEVLNYLVYIPAQPTLEEARAIVADMEQFDIKQHLIIDQGPYKNAISLGFFDDRKKAMRHAEYIRYLGYDARYTEQKSPREVFWLDYDEPFGANTPVIAWSRAIDSSANLQLLPRACR